MTQAYRGYLITAVRNGSFTISKDGFHISFADSIEGAKLIINMIADDP